MTTSTTFDHSMERLAAGERLPADDIRALAAGPDILPLGMLADAVRRRLNGTRVTYLRVASCAIGAPFDAIPPGAAEIRITGSPESLEEAARVVLRAKAVAGDRTLAAFSWADIERVAGSAGLHVSQVLERLRDAGLDSVAGLPLDAMTEPAVAIDRLTAAGFQRLRLTIDRAPAAERTTLLLRAAELQDQFACIQAVNPLPGTIDAFRPTTGYEDVKMVAVARLAAPNVPTIQVDWLQYGPKLAQVALTFGADDLCGVSASDDAPDGRRRAPIEDLRRNIEAAGFEPAARDGRFTVLA